MEQKRFITAGEVFQLFGVDAEALEALVQSGEVKALADLGTFKYRSEDFANLVKAGKLSPRTSGEMFQVDAKGDMPFLKVKDDDHGLKFDENVSFIELDEDALNQADPSRELKTPVVPENWFEDEEELDTSDTLHDLPVAPSEAIAKEGVTDFDLKIDPKSERTEDSDSNVRVFDEDASIDFDEPNVSSSTSDSDVRLEGPISAPSFRSPAVRKKPDSDSDVRLAKKAGNSDSDSDVTIAPSSKGVAASASTKSPSAGVNPDSDSDVKLASSVGSSPDSDSDVQLVSGKSPESDSDVQLVSPTHADDAPVSMTNAAAKARSSESDSDVLLVGAESEHAAAKKPDSDSDVRLADSVHELSVASDTTSATGDSNVRLEPVDGDLSDQSPQSPAGLVYDDDDSGIQLDASDSGIRLETVDSGISIEGARTDSEIAIESVTADSGIAMESALADSGIALEPTKSDSGISLEGARTDSEITIPSATDDSGIAMESVFADSGIALEPSGADSGISLEGARTDSEISIHPDSGIGMQSVHADSGLALESNVVDSGISLDAGTADSGLALDLFHDDSGLSLDSFAPDSGISVESGDSGIMVEKADSGLSLDSAGESGIRLGGIDSGLALEDPSDPSATIADVDIVDFEPTVMDFNQTQTLELSGEHDQDSGFDVSLADGDHTMEMALDDEDSAPESAATIVHKGRSSGPKSSNLSEAFNLDDSVEVEELDISEDLESVAEAEYSGEFAEAEEEVLEASDDDFSAGEISVAEDEDSEEFAPVAKVRALPKEPAWGLLAVAPIACASLVMAATVMVLWGGIATMWTGGEAPGPAGMLISTLAGLI